MACDPAALLADAQCWFSCSSAGLNDAMEVMLLCALRDGDTTMACDPQSLMTEAHCLSSCIPQGMMGAVKLGLLCQIVQAGGGGGGGGSCLYCGLVDPVAPPTCNCALAYNSATATFFYWNATDAAWYAFLGPLL